MGMYDELRCKYPLPVKGANDLLYQTKDTPSQFIDLYEIRADGTVWRQNYDIKDRSDPKAEGLERIIGCMTRINKALGKSEGFQRWNPVLYLLGRAEHRLDRVLGPLRRGQAQKHGLGRPPASRSQVGG